MFLCHALATHGALGAPWAVGQTALCPFLCGQQAFPVRGRLTESLTSGQLENACGDPQTLFNILGEFSSLEGIGYVVVN